MIYKKLENVTTITAGQYEQALKKYPSLSNLYSLVKEFTAIFSKNLEKLDSWIESAKKKSIPELQPFVEGILKDSTAIKNGFIYPYNNGLAEGSVNKIKVIKRTMYGRNNFEPLKAKVLFHELFTLNATNNGKNLWSIYNKGIHVERRNRGEWRTVFY